MCRLLQHVTITTGHTRASPLSEVRDDTMTAVRGHLAEGAALPDGWEVKLVAAPEGTYVYDIHSAGERIVSCYLCDDRLQSRAMWHTIKAAMARIEKLPADPPPVPWLAVSLSMRPAVLAEISAETIMAAADLERCVAWTLMG